MKPDRLSIPPMAPAGKPTRLKVELPPDLAADLTRYRTAYRETYGTDVGEADLVPQIVRTFLDRDRSFLRWKRGAGEQETGRGKPQPAAEEPASGRSVRAGAAPGEA
jgi:hypothetical protein